jgi:disulfide oxidoreductase YuzD
MDTQTSTEQKVEMTTDYDQFKFLKGNREVDEAHVVRLIKSMKANDLFTPIMVNNNLEVIDGQHRLEARRRLQLIVPYINVGEYGLAEVQQINAQQKKWTIEDYTDSYIALGLKDYEVYRWFRKRYKLPHTVTVPLLSGVDYANSSHLGKSFIEGSFRVRSLESAKDVAEHIEKVAPHFSGYRDRSFVLAVIRLLDKKSFSFTKFIDKIQQNPLMMKKCATSDQYIDLIEEIYNYRSQNKVSLRYSE